MDTPNMNECSLAIGRTIGKRAMLYLGILVFAFALLLLLNSSNASAAVQHVSGDVSGIWHTGDTVYVDTDINVPTGQTLNISNGVNVFFDSGTGLTVYGTLNAISTNANAPINFTANTTTPFAGYWTGITFNAGVGITSVIDTAHIQYSTFGVQSIDSKVNLAHATLNDISGTAVSMTRDTSVLPDLSVTLHQLVIYNVYDGIVINGIGKNLTVTVDSVTITNAVRWGVHLNADVGFVNFAMSDATFDNAPYTIEVWGNRTVHASLTNVAINDTSGEAIGIWSFNGNVNAILNDVTAVNLTANAGIVVRADQGNSDTIMNGVTVQNRVEGTYGIYFLLSNTTTAHLTDVFVEGFYYGVYYDDAGSVSITMDPSTIIGPDGGYGFWIDAKSAELALTDVTISNVSCGISMISTSGLADLSLVNVLISGTNLNQGIIVSAESNNASVEIAGLTIEMNPAIDPITLLIADPDYDGINVFANDSIDFTATDLVINNSYDGVQLTTNNGGMVVDVTGALITNSPEAGILMNSGAELEITVSDSAFNLDFISNVWISDWAIEGYAAEHIDVTITNVTIGWLNGVKLVADTEYVEAVFTNVDITSGSTDITWFVAAISGIDLQCNEGYVDATLNNVSVDLTRDMWLYGDTTGDGIFILSNGTVNLGLSNVDIETAFVNGIYVESFNGMIEATLTDVMVNDSWQSGILLYSDVDAVDLTMTDSQVTNSNIGDGIVAQGVADVNLVFDNVTVDGALDGLLALSTDGNVTADFSDITVMNCETGIRILAPNGRISMGMDPSIIESVNTGIYLDAMGSVDLSIIDSFVGDAGIGIEIHSFDGGINVLLDNSEIGFTDVYGLFADADNSDIMVSSINNTLMNHNAVGWYLVTSNGSVSFDVDTSSFEYGATGILVESSIDLNANVANSSFLGQGVLGMNLNADVNITLNVVGSTFDGQIAENAQLFYPTMSEGQYIIIQPEAGNWTTDQGKIATLPFGFDFNGVTYTEVLMSLNGWLAFGPAGAPDATFIQYHRQAFTAIDRPFPDAFTRGVSGAGKS